MDYTIESPEERIKLVEQILAETPEPSPEYLEKLADYIIFCVAKQEKKQGINNGIITDNRMVTINKRETSFEGLVSQFENGEDRIYNLFTEDKSVIFKPKIKITKEDLEEIPPLQQIRDAIESWEKQLKTTTGRQTYVIKKAIIDLRKDQYIVKNAYRCPITMKKLTRATFPISLPCEEWIDENGDVKYSGASLINTQLCQVILCNYSKLKQNSQEELSGDIKYLIQEFEDTCDKALEKYDLYQRLVEYKIDGMQNLEIQKELEKEFGVRHSVEYLSSLWRKKIPKMIAEQAELNYLNWYYTYKEQGTYKRCSRCGEVKLAHNKYFSRNKTSKDGFYSICKECRNERNAENGQEPLIDAEDISF